MVGTDAKYSRSSLALKQNDFYYEDATEYNIPVKRPVAKAQPVSRIKPLLILFTFAALSFIIIYRYALINNLNYTMDKTQKAYTDLKNANDDLKLKLLSQQDLRKIEKTAVEHLGMQKPDRDQIIYITIPKYSSCVVSDAYYEEEGQNGFLATISNEFGNLLHYIY